METEHIEKWIKDAVDGGWKPFEKDERVHKKIGVEEDGWIVFTTQVNVRRRNLAEILLDPEAWKAVYGFEKVDYGNGMTESEYQKSIDELNEAVDRTTIRKWGIEKQDRWEWYWTLFFSYLADGKTINQALEALNY